MSLISSLSQTFKLLALAATFTGVSAFATFTYKLPGDTFDTTGFASSIGAGGGTWTAAASYEVDQNYTSLTGVSFGGQDVNSAALSKITVFIYGAAANSPIGLSLLYTESFLNPDWANNALNTVNFAQQVDVSGYNYFFTALEYNDSSTGSYQMGTTAGASDATWVVVGPLTDPQDFQLLSSFALYYTAVIHTHAASAIPEPSTYALMAGAAIGLFVMVRRKRA